MLVYLMDTCLWTLKLRPQTTWDLEQLFYPTDNLSTHLQTSDYVQNNVIAHTQKQRSIEVII